MALIAALPRRAALAFALALPVGAVAQVPSAASPATPQHPGRVLFAKKGCIACHYFEAHGAAASAKSMRARLAGASERASAAIEATREHAESLKGLSTGDTQAIAEWLAGGATAGAKPTKPAPPTQPVNKVLPAPALSSKPVPTTTKAAAAAPAPSLAAPPAQAVVEPRAAPNTEVPAPSKPSADALKDAEDRSRREAESEAQRRRDADEAAKRREADEAAKRREAETQAAKKAAEPAPPQTKPAVQDGGGRKQLGYRDGSDLPPCPPPTGAPGAPDENRAKEIIDRVGCPQCHAWVQKKTGPPMKSIHEKYKGDAECVVSRLKNNKTHNDEGVTRDLKGDEFRVLADYIATRKK